MKFSDYQKLSKETALYPNKGRNYIYPLLGICGESGELAEKIKKVIREKDGKISPSEKIEIVKELGDILWYLSQFATELNLSLEEIAKENIVKLQSRKERGKLHGSGDNR